MNFSLLGFSFFLLILSLPLYAQQSRFVSEESMYNPAFVHDVENMFPHAELIFDKAFMEIKESGKSDFKFQFPELFPLHQSVNLHGCKNDICIDLNVKMISYTDILLDIRMSISKDKFSEGPFTAVLNSGIVLATCRDEDEKGDFYDAYLYSANPNDDDWLFLRIGNCGNGVYCAYLERLGAKEEMKNISGEAAFLLKSRHKE